MEHTPSPLALTTSRAPRTNRAALIAASAAPEDGDLALYGNFLSDIGQIDRGIPHDSLVGKIQDAFDEYQPAAADSIRINLVADGPKLRSARSVAMRSLDPDQQRQALNMQGAARKKRLIDDAHKYHDELDILCGSHCWLPAGVDLQSISYDNLLNIRKIVKWALSNNRAPATLWQPDGELHNVRYTGRPLLHVWQKVSGQGIREASLDAHDQGNSSEGQALPEDGKEGDDLPMTPPGNSGHVNGSDAGDHLPPFDPLLSDSKSAEKSADNPVESIDADNSSPETGRRGRLPTPGTDSLFSPITSLAPHDGGKQGAAARRNVASVSS
ncbi:hypothetical protein EsH8_XIII_000021 [Colletotrichum jinshuiense]